MTVPIKSTMGPRGLRAAALSGAALEAERHPVAALRIEVKAVAARRRREGGQGGPRGAEIRDVEHQAGEPLAIGVVG